MKNSNLLKLGLATTLAGSVGVVNAATLDGTAVAKVITPITITETQPISFGTFSSDAGGDIVITPAGGVTNPVGIDLVAASTQQQGIYNVAGEATYNVTVSTSGTATLANAAGDTMALSLISLSTTNFVAAAAPGTDVGIGATLTVLGGQAAGDYSTANIATGGVPFVITVTYD